MRVVGFAGGAALAVGFLSALVAFFGWVSAAAAVSQPGDVYIVDVGRQLPDGSTVDGAIVRIDPATKAETTIVPAIGGVTRTLVDPTGITVDKQGYLIVADQGGGETDDIYSPCPDGCGTVLRVNPSSGASEIVSQGSPGTPPLWTNPSAVLLPPDGDITDDRGGIEDRLLVTDQGNQNVIAVDPSRPFTDNQSYFYSNYPHVDTNVNPSPPYDGLRSPWDLAREAGTGDILVTNTGENPVGLQNAAGCEAGEQDGYVARLDQHGTVTGYICDPDFRAPRGIVIGDDRAHTILITDPISQPSGPSGGTEYGALYRHASGATQLLSGGDRFATPSGLAFAYSGTSLLIADESAFAAATPCNADGGACGGLVSVNAFYGDQGQFLPQVSGVTSLHDPIDVAVDRQGACKTMSNKPLKPPPNCKPKKKPKQECRKGSADSDKKCEKKPDVRWLRSFNNTEITYQGFPGTREGIQIYPLRGFDPGRTKVLLDCLSEPCPGDRGPVRAASDEVVFCYPACDVQPTREELLRGTFRVVSFVPKRGQGNPKVVYRGRFKDYSFSPGGANEKVRLVRKGCLDPYEHRVTGETKAPCPSDGA